MPTTRPMSRNGGSERDGSVVARASVRAPRRLGRLLPTRRPVAALVFAGLIVSVAGGIGLDEKAKHDPPPSSRVGATFDSEGERILPSAPASIPAASSLPRGGPQQSPSQAVPLTLRDYVSSAAAGPAQVLYPGGETVTWPAAPGGRTWVDPNAGLVTVTQGGRQWQSQLLALAPGSTPVPNYVALEYASEPRIGAYLATVVDGAAQFGEQNALVAGRTLTVRATQGGESLLGSDYDKCGTWPGPGNSLGTEGLAPDSPEQTYDSPARTLRCSLVRERGQAIVHAEVLAKADGTQRSLGGVTRESFTVRTDGTAVSVASNAVAVAGHQAPLPVREWAFLDTLVATIQYPTAN